VLSRSHHSARRDWLGLPPYARSTPPSSSWEASPPWRSTFWSVLGRPGPHRPVVEATLITSGIGPVLFLRRHLSGNNESRWRYAQCLASRFDSVLCNNERTGVMQPVFAPRVSRLSPRGAGESREVPPVKFHIQSATSRSAIAEAGIGVVLLMALVRGGAIVTKHVAIQGAVAINTNAAYAATAVANADQAGRGQRPDQATSTSARSRTGSLAGQRDTRWA
jgi:hypothetical protein